MTQYSKAALELHRAMVDLAKGDKAADMIAALSLTMAYGIKYHDNGKNPVAALNLINRLVLMELIDPNSEMEKPS